VDTEGRVRGVLGMAADARFIALLGPVGEARAVLRVTADGVALDLLDTAGKLPAAVVR
jgi:hypothetical protein